MILIEKKIEINALRETLNYSELDDTAVIRCY